MNACSGCGMMRCEGDCYLASPSDFPAESSEQIESTLTDEDRKAFTDWCAIQDARREQLTETRGDPFLDREEAA
jgi:hypothetical protein